MTLLRDLIPIPERVHQSDFVLRLTEGLAHAERTLDDYVVTEQLVHCFDDALGVIQKAVATGVSKAVYLHGSFGSGKSHFMAVLSLLLAGNPRARSIVELAPVVARHNGWTEGRRFLLVPYHMIGSNDLESAILGGYADHVRRLHPQAPIPGFYLAEHLFRDADAMRARMGDEAFLGALNETAGGAASGWGGLAGGWTTEGYESARLEAPDGDERIRLVGDLIAAFFRSYQTAAGVQGESFLPLDQGLAVLSKHARDLGYDAVILFLDELILWLASRAADLAFVSSEGAKLSKLVEAQHADRPVPLVSFVARQRDLRELVGENLAGSLQLQFSDALKYWEARFEKIRLEDRNLPVIAERRVLRPVDERARAEIDGAFDALRGLRADVSATLLTDEGKWQEFRQVYPFSPALVQTLIAVSSVLQRERTALKLMQQLLVDRRGDLELGQLIPVGDLFDVIAEGDEPFSDAMRLHFDNAKRLYYQKLLPMLERRHGVTWQDVRAGVADAEAALRLKNDARLLKTLLLAALVPEVESLRALTAQRLAALNHGTIKAPIPGREAQIVLGRCREWAAEVGEIKVSEDLNPILSIQVTGVDVAPILENAASHDNPGNRRRKIRELLFRELGVAEGNDLFSTYSFPWRGTRREVDVVFDNVRELIEDSRLRGRDGAWTLLLDFPFDDAGVHPPGRRGAAPALSGCRPDRRLAAELPESKGPEGARDPGPHRRGPDRRAPRGLRGPPVPGGPGAGQGAAEEPAEPVAAAHTPVPGGRLRDRERATGRGGSGPGARGAAPQPRPHLKPAHPRRIEPEGGVRRLARSDPRPPVPGPPAFRHRCAPGRGAEGLRGHPGGVAATGPPRLRPGQAVAGPGAVRRRTPQARADGRYPLRARHPLARPLPSTPRPGGRGPRGRRRQPPCPRRPCASCAAGSTTRTPWGCRSSSRTWSYSPTPIRPTGPSSSATRRSRSPSSASRTTASCGNRRCRPRTCGSRRSPGWRACSARWRPRGSMPPMSPAWSRT